MVYTKEEAIAFCQSIPAFKAVYVPEAIAFLTSLIEFTAGTYAADGAIAYRPWIAAAFYLVQSPSVWLVKKHDQTTVGDPKAVVDFLLKQQAAEDERDGVIPPEGETAIAALNVGALSASRIGIGTYWERELIAQRVAPEQQTLRLRRLLEWRPYI